MPSEKLDTRSFTANILQLNVAILFISTSGVLGRHIGLPAPVTIAIRALLAAIILSIFCKWKGVSFNILKKDWKRIGLSGLLLGAHWVTYFYALQLSNVAIGMLSLFTYPVITAFLEPLFVKTKIQKAHLLLGVIILVGIYFLVPEFNFKHDHSKAIGFGVLSAFCYAIRNLLLKPIVSQYNGSILMMNQLFVIAIFLCPVIPFFEDLNIVQYLPATLLLALLTTAIGHTLFLYSLKHFSTVSASIISCLQPIYGILLGIAFLQEYPAPHTILGGTIIISTVVIESFRVYKKGAKTRNKH